MGKFKFEKFKFAAFFRFGGLRQWMHPLGMQSHPQPPQRLFSELIGRTHFSDLLTACATTRDSFLQQYVPMAERLAICVQDLPLSPTVFSRPGGALQFGLQAGLLAVRSCDAVIFAPKATAQERQHDDPLYRWCAYCAAVASAYLICAGSVEVTLGSGQRHSFAGRWALGELGSKFTARWHEEPALPQQAGLIYLQTFFFLGQFSHLSPALLGQLGAAINPAMAMTGSETPLGKVVRLSLSRVLEFQREHDAQIIKGTASAVMGDLPPDVTTGLVKDELRPAAYSAHAAQPVQQTVAGVPPTVPTDSSAPTVATTTQSPIPVVSTTPAQATTSVPVPAPAFDPAMGINIKVVEWVRALAFAVHLDADIQVTDEGTLRLGRKALAFASTPKENYLALYEAGCVLQKSEHYAVCTQALAQIYQQAKLNKGKAE